MLLGTWQATHLLERADSLGVGRGENATVAGGTGLGGFSPGDTVDVRLEDVSLRFEPDGDYVYTSTLDYFEEGTFELDGDLLTTVAAVDSVGEQRVRVTRLDDRRLHLLMEDAGRRRELGFERVGAAE